MKYRLIIVAIIVIPLALIIFLARKGVMIIPLFMLPKTSQQLISGENCDELPELFQRNACYQSAAFNQRDATLCERIVVSAEDETSSQNKGLCYKNIARITHNPSLCEKAGQFQTECLLEVGQ